MRGVRACNVAELFLALTMLVIKPSMYDEDEMAVLVECQSHVAMHCGQIFGSRYTCTPAEYSQGYHRQAIFLAVVACAFLWAWQHTLKALREKSASTTGGIYDSAPS